MIKDLNLILAVELVFAFFFSFATLFLLRKVARRFNLVDKPNARKTHEGTVPLVGGISIGLSIIYFLFNHPSLLPGSVLYMSMISILLIIGVLDDKYDISFKLRFFAQIAIAIALMKIGEIELKSLGDILGTGDIVLGWVGYLITGIAVVGAINAFNMMDGIDGLLGGVSIVTFSTLGFLMHKAGQYNLAYFCLVLIVIILPYILLNLGAFGRKKKVFMGDAGSMLIGFTVVWLLLTSTQTTDAPLRAVTALWLIAIPLFDMATIMIRRIRKGVSPFQPDREHLHHIFQRLGLSPAQTLIAICSIAIILAGIGLCSEMVGIPEYVMFYLFVACFILYFLLLNNIESYVTKKK